MIVMNDKDIQFLCMKNPPARLHLWGGILQREIYFYRRYSMEIYHQR